MNDSLQKEIIKLKNDIISKESALESEKYIFERQLLNDLGKEIIYTLNNPPKKSLILKIKLKFLRFIKKYKERKYFNK